jgi:hypothetical protein
MSELVTAAAHDELLILTRGKVRLHGIDFDEDFLSELIARHFRRQQWQAEPLFSDAYVVVFNRQDIKPLVNDEFFGLLKLEFP